MLRWLLHLDDTHVFRRVLDLKPYRFRATGFNWAKPTNPILDPPDSNPDPPPKPILLPTKSTATTWFLFFKCPQLFARLNFPNLRHHGSCVGSDLDPFFFFFQSFTFEKFIGIEGLIGGKRHSEKLNERERENRRSSEIGKID
ncbi:hypothetical protein CMV_003202 [Castanea mollissima]|uniref:Uncharacterized protein n=1 Tax=Castanea mollissima TaxID=60419 RepID=A0A8J4VWW6_9ROSI|nr:hypothetical protein CMV_003202 [Castanea mollissima]